MFAIDIDWIPDRQPLLSFLFVFRFWHEKLDGIFNQLNVLSLSLTMTLYQSDDKQLCTNKEPISLNRFSAPFVVQYMYYIQQRKNELIYKKYLSFRCVSTGKIYMYMFRLLAYVFMWLYTCILMYIEQQ